MKPMKLGDIVKVIEVNYSYADIETLNCIGIIFVKDRKIKGVCAHVRTLPYRRLHREQYYYLKQLEKL